MTNPLGKNRLTTFGGLIATIGGVLALLPKSVGVDPQWGAFVVALGSAIAGFAARDFDRHSTQTEVREATREDAIDKADAELRRG